MIEIEMRKTTKYYLNKHEVVQLLIKKYSEEEVLEFGRGAVSLLQNYSSIIDEQLKKCSKLFSVILSSHDKDTDFEEDEEEEDEDDDDDDYDA